MPKVPHCEWLVGGGGGCRRPRRHAAASEALVDAHVGLGALGAVELQRRADLLGGDLGLDVAKRALAVQRAPRKRLRGRVRMMTRSRRCFVAALRPPPRSRSTRAPRRRFFARTGVTHAAPHPRHQWQRRQFIGALRVAVVIVARGLESGRRRESGESRCRVTRRTSPRRAPSEAVGR